MSEVYRRAKDEAGYNATIFLRMLSERGAIATAHALIKTEQPSDGFTRLWERHRLDLTVEAHVWQAGVRVTLHRRRTSKSVG